ncbi:hypothetical protein [Streptomyces sp. ISL-12]|nr:hypothetical protein [Streptomyces sp. ISL-12]
MNTTTEHAPAVPQLPVLASADVDTVTLGSQNFNDSDKSNYFEN